MKGRDTIPEGHPRRNGTVFMITKTLLELSLLLILGVRLKTLLVGGETDPYKLFGRRGQSR